MEQEQLGGGSRLGLEMGLEHCSKYFMVARNRVFARVLSVFNSLKCAEHYAYTVKHSSCLAGHVPRGSCRMQASNRHMWSLLASLQNR